MKNIVLASLLGFGLISSAWATETVNIHDRVNNAQAPAHQMQSAGHCCKVSDEAAFCLIQRPYISKTLLTRRISPRGSP